MKFIQKWLFHGMFRSLMPLLAVSTGLAAPAYEMRSYAVVKSKTQSIFAWCDSPARVLALASVDGKTQLYHWAKSRAGLGSLSTSQVTVGQADPGAGQIYYPLKVISGSRNGDSGFLHLSNIENVQDPAYRMTHVNEFKLGKNIYSCRYVPQAAFIGVTSKRTVIVWDVGDVVTYATRNFDSTAGVYISDGKANHDELGTGYTFLAKDGYSYEVYSSPSAAFITVKKNGKTLLTEKFLAYSVSIPSK